MTFHDALSLLVTTTEGRTVLSELIFHFGYGECMYDSNESKRDFLLGQQSVACFLQSQIDSLDDFAWPEFLMALKKDELNAGNDERTDDAAE